MIATVISDIASDLARGDVLEPMSNSPANARKTGVIEIPVVDGSRVLIEKGEGQLTMCYSVRLPN